ncbi:hypothetical protein ACQKP0_18395 [Heyndrickxia sp. NPDC080065]|uniref:hypothetical protein n=1 Tax=Heyndrickxia sp. NPDC080065 TaxID=3390568 RepID=UPI003D085669
MNKFLKLVNFEMNRFRKFFLILLGITLTLQFVGVVVESMIYTNKAKQLMNEQSMTAAQYVQDYGHMAFTHIINTLWFLGPIAICSVAITFYIFLIWYRDWFGKNTFIYRLLMLPTSRLNLFLSKAITIFLLVLGLIAFQLIILPLENAVLKGIVPSELRYDLELREILSVKYINFIIPSSFFEFFLHYGTGLIAIFVIFTGILFERSYRLKGIVIGILYTIGAAIVLFSPYLVEMIFHKNLLYPIEIFVLLLITGVIVLLGSLYISGYLLKKKVTV